MSILKLFDRRIIKKLSECPFLKLFESLFQNWVNAYFEVNWMSFLSLVSKIWVSILKLFIIIGTATVKLPFQFLSTRYNRKQWTSECLLWRSRTYNHSNFCSQETIANDGHLNVHCDNPELTGPGITVLSWISTGPSWREACLSRPVCPWNTPGIHEQTGLHSQNS